MAIAVTYALEAGVAGTAGLSENTILGTCVAIFGPLTNPITAVHAALCLLITRLIRAWISAGQAARRLTGLTTVAVQAIVADSIIGHMLARVRILIAAVNRAIDTIVAVRGWARLAHSCNTYLTPVAEEAVIAVSMVSTYSGGQVGSRTSKQVGLKGNPPICPWTKVEVRLGYLICLA